MKKIIFLFIITLVSFLVTNVFALETASINIEGVGIEEAELSVIKDLIIHELESNEVIITDGEAGIVYKVKALALGAKIIISIDKIRKDNGQIIHSEKASASTLDEVDKVIPRLVTAILDKNEFSDTAKYKTVTDNEAEKPKKIKSEFYYGVGLLLNYITEPDIGNKLMYGFTLKSFYEMQNFRADMDIVFSMNKTEDSTDEYNDNLNGFMSFSIVLNYLFLDSDISPFIGTGLGYAISSYYSETASYTNNGPYVPLSIGVEFMRLYDIKLIAQVQANFHLQKNEKEKYQDQLKYIVPVYFSLTIAFSFEDFCNDCF